MELNPHIGSSLDEAFTAEELAAIGKPARRGRPAPAFEEAAKPVGRKQVVCARCGKPSGVVTLTKDGTEMVCAKDCKFQEGIVVLRNMKRMLASLRGRK